MTVTTPYAPYPAPPPAGRQGSNALFLYLAANLAALPVLFQDFFSPLAQFLGTLFSDAAGWIILRVWRAFLHLSGQGYDLNGLIASVDAYREILYELAAYPVIMLLPFALFALFRRISRREITGGERAPLLVYPAAVFCGLGISVAAGYFMNFLSYVMELLGFYEVSYPGVMPFDGMSLGLQILSVCVLPALLEEFAYRGVLYAEVTRFGGTRAAIVITALFFTLMHGSLMILPLALPFGLLIGWVRGRYETILPGMLAHFAVNLLSVLSDYSWMKLDDGQYYALWNTLDPVLLLLGLLGLLYFLGAHRFRLRPMTQRFYLGLSPAFPAVGRYLLAVTSIVFFLFCLISMASRFAPIW